MAKEYAVPLDRVTIEVTESANPEHLAAVVKSLSLLRSQGCKISMDDFGTGFSTLNLLSRIPFTELKIDQMFVAGIHKNQKLTTMLESIVHLAKQLHLSTVAEGIETEQQLTFIRALGCNIGQGYYFGRPVRDLAMSNIDGEANLAHA